ncbi:2-hydroxyacid dehydrogenase [Amycolatopsis sp. NPDC051372]|uniref:2-hydroxyacid dehydrogenase n=1 Tax=Amycolatopsis sp. NPDC051372 TaxID=3155669 RepID=UPI003433FB8B
MVDQMEPVVAERCAERYDLIKAWDVDREAVLQARGHDVSALLASGATAVDGRLLDRLPNLQIITCGGVGFDYVDLRSATERGVVVTNTPGVLDDEVADTAIGLLLMTVRELSAAERWVREGHWASDGPYRLSPTTLASRTLGVVGLGRIGLAIAHRAEGFGLRISYHNRRRRGDVPERYAYYDTLVGLAAAVDTLMVVLPGGAGTYHAVNAHVLGALGREGVVINVGRGSVVDTDALVASLRSGSIAAAGLDVVEGEPLVPPELLDCPTAVVLPHVASGSVATRRAIGQLVLDNLESWFTSGTAVTPVRQVQ